MAHSSEFPHWNQALLLFLYPMGRIIPQSESELSDIFIIATTVKLGDKEQVKVS